MQKKLKVKAVFFDLWNTIALTDSKQDVFREMQIRFGLNELTHNQFVAECERAIMLDKFDSLDHLYSRILNYFSLPYGEIILGDLDFLWNHTLKSNKIFPEAKTALQKTKKKFKTALVSNCENIGFEALSKNFDFNKYFDEIILSCNVRLLKPNPRIFRMPLKRMNLEPEQAVMIGDSLRTDMLGARKTGLKTILIDRKGRHKGRTPPVDAVISSLNELDKVIDFR